MMDLEELLRFFYGDSVSERARQTARELGPAVIVQLIIDKLDAPEGRACQKLLIDNRAEAERMLAGIRGLT